MFLLPQSYTPVPNFRSQRQALIPKKLLESRKFSNPYRIIEDDGLSFDNFNMPLTLRRNDSFGTPKAGAALPRDMTLAFTELMAASMDSSTQLALCVVRT